MTADLVNGGPIDEIRTVAYIGAGMMGCVNSLVAAVSGYDVVLHDASGDMLGSVGERQAGIGAFMVGSGYCTPEALAAGLERVSTAADLADALADADLVSESIYEDRDAKRSVFRLVDELAPPRHDPHDEHLRLAGLRSRRRRRARRSIRGAALASRRTALRHRRRAAHVDGNDRHASSLRRDARRHTDGVEEGAPGLRVQLDERSGDADGRPARARRTCDVRAGRSSMDGRPQRTRWVPSA